MAQDVQQAQLYQRNPQAMASELEGNLILLNLEDGQYYDIGGAGTVLWGWLEEPHSAEQLVTRLTGSFDVDAETAARDVTAFLTELEAQGLVRRA